MNSDNSIVDLKTLENIDADYFNKILNDDYKSFSHMKTIFTIIQSIMNNEYYINELFKDKKHLQTSGHSSIFIIDILKQSKIIVKESYLPNYKISDEYNIGLVLNYIRQYIPTFCFVFARYGNKLLIENVDGITFNEWMDHNRDNVEDYVMILIQILLSLEIAQRLYRFSHGDLHPENILIRRKRESYKINIGNIEYKFTNVYVPVIIDYEFSSMTYNGKYVAQDVPVLIPNGDQLVLLNNILYERLGMCSIKSWTQSLVKNVYKISSSKDMDNLNKMYPLMQSLTPLNLVYYITSFFKSQKLSLSKRTTYLVQKPFPVEKIYDKLLGHNNFKLQLSSCLDNCQSYILDTYFSCNSETNYEKMENDRQTLTLILNNLYEHDATVFKNTCEAILRVDKFVKSELMNNLYMVMIEISLFKVMYYMCKESGIDDFTNIFNPNNENIKMHINNLELYERTIRWYTTLSELQ